MKNNFLHRDGQRIVDGNGKEVILKGWGLGNWLVQEGYMWESDGSPRFDRSRRIEQVIEELTGKEYSSRFWKKFHKNYIRREDIQYMSQLGYNSVRIPMNWRVFMDEDDPIVWKEDGFQLLDQCIEWCKEERMYVFLDLHAAPGGQTGANIDDSIDDVPRLLTDEWAWEKGLALWEKLAERYAEESWVGGYDILNEPIAVRTPGQKTYYHLESKLIEFYKETIKRIRKVDQKHMLSIEGIRYATSVSTFTERFDDNMVLHFHRYAEPPEIKCLEQYRKKAEELNIPLWLGESGENCNEWYAALYPLAASLGIGYNLWPWKKMSCTNSPCSIRRPKDFDKILEYTKGGPHPGYEASRKIFDEYLECILLENCELHEEVTHHVFRQAPFVLQAVDFDAAGGKGISYSGNYTGICPVDYRNNSGMNLVELEPLHENRHVFDCQWDRYGLCLTAGEFAVYTVSETQSLTVTLEIAAGDAADMILEAGGNSKEVPVKAGQGLVCVTWESMAVSSVKVTVVRGKMILKRFVFDKV